MLSPDERVSASCISYYFGHSWSWPLIGQALTALASHWSELKSLTHYRLAVTTLGIQQQFASKDVGTP